MDHVRLNQAIADFALLTFENQEWLIGCVGSQPWAADLPAARLTLGEQTFTMALLGTHAEDSDTFRWGWANMAHLGLGEDHHVVAPVVQHVRSRAEQLQLPELAEPQFPVAGINDLGWLPAAGIASVAAGLLGAPAVYSGPYDGGRAWFAVLDSPTPRANPIKFGRFSDQAWAAARSSPTWEQDGVRMRQAVLLYGHRRGLDPQPDADGGIVLHYPGGGTLKTSFDEQDRLVNIEASISKGDVPDPLPFEQRGQ